MTTLLTLKNDVQTYMRRDDAAFVAAIPTFIRNVEAKFRREIQHSSQEVISELTATGRTVDLPVDCVETRALTLQNDSRRRLDWRSAEAIREGRHWGSAGTPVEFSIEGRKIVLAPNPGDDGVTMDHVYYQAYPALVNDADSNWLLTNAYDLFLTAVLAEAAKFVQDEQKHIEWKTDFELMKKALLDQDISHATRGSASRQFQTRWKGP